WALGLNAAGGNLGVAVLQLVAPVVVAAGAGLHLARAGLMWVPLILVSAACAWRFMDNLTTARSSLRDQLAVARRRHTWIVAWLYVGTFGSFIGFSAGLPLLISQEFADPHAVGYAFLGPLVGSLARPLGGRLADRFGGARVTLGSFVVMAGAVLGVVAVLAAEHHPYAFAGFLGLFLVLFVASGVGNGSTFRMVPVIFRAHHVEQGGDEAARQEAVVTSRRETAAVLGLTSAVGAYGGFLVPQTFGLSAGATGGVHAALLAFVAFYASCMAVVWWCYLRRSFALRRAPNLAWARP
ncbi:MAG: MFS transporter, partial [Actinomycetota bacterium]|nr:MFS transporter [Actinomycetota bacterium]